MTPARLRWGLLLIMIGVLALLARADLWHIGIASFIVTFLPIMLIAIGIEKIFTNSRYQVIAFAAPIMMVLAGFAIASTGDNLSFDAGFIEAKILKEPLPDGIRFLEAAIDLDQGDLTIRDATDELFEARFREFSSKPAYALTRVGDSAHISLASTDGRIWGGLVHIDTDEPDDWHLAFSREVPLGLTCSGSNSDIHLNMQFMPLKALAIDAHDSEIYVKLGKLIPNVSVSVAGLDSELRLRVPRTSGLRVRGLNDATYLYEIGLIKREDAFITSGFDTISTQIDVDLDERFRSLSIDYY